MYRGVLLDGASHVLGRTAMMMAALNSGYYHRMVSKCRRGRELCVDDRPRARTDVGVRALPAGVSRSQQ
jgi:hypothetical protein